MAILASTTRPPLRSESPEGSGRCADEAAEEGRESGAPRAGSPSPRRAVAVVLAAALGLSWLDPGSARGADDSEDPGPLIFMTEDRPPNNFRDPKTGEIVGTSVDTLRAIVAELGWRVEFKLETWSRSYAVALTEPKTCVFSTARIAGRDPLFKWVGPFDTVTFAMAAMKDRGITLMTIDDARPYRIGVYTQDARELMLRQTGGFRLDATSTGQLNARKLQEGRIDLWFTDVEAFGTMDPAERADMELVLRLPPRPLYLACNSSFPDKTIAMMNMTLVDLGLLDETAVKPDL